MKCMVLAMQNVLIVKKGNTTMLKRIILFLISITLFGCAMTISETENGCRLSGLGGGEGEIEGKCKVKKGIITIPDLTVKN